MSKIFLNIISLSIISLGMILAFIINHFSSLLSATSFWQALIIAILLGLIEIFYVHKFTTIVPQYYRLGNDGAFPFISIGVASAMLILR